MPPAHKHSTTNSPRRPSLTTVTSSELPDPKAFFIPGESEKTKRRRHNALFQELKTRVENSKDGNLLEARNGWFFLNCISVHLSIAFAAWLCFQATTPVHWVGIGILAGINSVQIGMLGHEVGHYQYFRGKDHEKHGDLLRWYLGNVCLGIAWSWWVAKHFAHHTTPNKMGSDPDIEFDWLAFTKEQLAEKNQDSVTQFLLGNQWWLFWFYLPWQALNARQTSFRSLKKESPRREDFRFQVIGIGIHATLYLLILGAIVLFDGWIPMLLFTAFHQWTHGLYNSLVFATNHKGMKAYLATEIATFLEFQILTSRDVKGYWWLPDAILTQGQGGLNHQVAHHLFPLAPRVNLGKIQKIIEEFCVEKGIPYCRESVHQAYWHVGANFKEVSGDLIESPMGA